MIQQEYFRKNYIRDTIKRKIYEKSSGAHPGYILGMIAHFVTLT